MKGVFMDNELKELFGDKALSYDDFTKAIEGNETCQPISWRLCC